METWALNLRDAIEHSGLSVPQVAEKSGLTKAILYRYLKGIAEPKISSLTALSPVLGVSTGALLEKPKTPWDRRLLTYALQVPDQIKKAIKVKTFQPLVLDESGNPIEIGIISVAGKDYPVHEAKKDWATPPEGEMYPVIWVPIDALLWKKIEERKGDVKVIPEWKKFQDSLIADFKGVGVDYQDCEKMIVYRNIQIFPSSEEIFEKLKPEGKS